MVLAVAVGVLAGAAVGPPPGWGLATVIALAALLAAVLLRGSRGTARVASAAGSRAPWRSRRAGFHGSWRPRRAGLHGSGRSGAPGSHGPGQSRLWVHGVLALGVLGLAGAGVAGARAAAVHQGVLVGLVGRGGTVTVDATVAEEPHLVRYGGRWVVLSVRRVEVAGQSWRTRERVGVTLPGTAGAVAVGDRLTVSGGVERSDRGDALGGEPATVLRRPRIVSRSPSRSWLLRASETVRAAVRQRALDTLPPERAGLLVGIALGDTSLEPAELDRAFTTAGLTHLTAVSGQNLAVVLAAGLGIAVAFRARRPLLAGLGVALVALFALLTRWEPSVLRASAMAILALLGVATGRGPGGRRALCLGAMLLLLANPALVSSLGFRLSVAATAGVLWLGPTATQILPGRLPHVVRSAIGISLGAQAGATPVLALAFGQISMAGLAANLVAVPVATAPMLLGVVAAAAAVIGPLGAIATLACRLADPFLAALVAIAEHTSSLPAASLSLSGPARLLPVLVVLACTLLARRRALALERAADDRRVRRYRSHHHAYPGRLPDSPLPAGEAADPGGGGPADAAGPASGREEPADAAGGPAGGMGEPPDVPPAVRGRSSGGDRSEIRVWGGMDR
jgi:competence protein ComEC